MPSGNDEHQAMPRWVKWFGIGTVVLIGAFILVHLLGGAPRHH